MCRKSLIRKNQQKHIFIEPKIAWLQSRFVVPYVVFIHRFNNFHVKWIKQF